MPPDDNSPEEQDDDEHQEPEVLDSFYFSASGPSFSTCAFLGQRYVADYGFKPHEGESWVMANAGSATAVRTTPCFGTTSWLTRLWRAPSGTVFVSNANEGLVMRFTDVGEPTQHWEEMPLDAAMSGVWGLDERRVWAWGTRHPATPVLYRFDGRAWSEVPAPDFQVRALHGLAPDFLYAVGVQGGVARWDGRAWLHYPMPSDETLVSVFVAGPDEVYASGASGGLYEGSAHGWGKIAQGALPLTPLYAVAKWKGQLWVAGGALGLLRRVGITDELEKVKPNLKCFDLDARGELLISCEHFVVSTADGQSYAGVGGNVLLQHRAGVPLGRF